MTVEMILRNIEHYPHVRTQGIERLQLEAGNFRHGHVVFSQRYVFDHRRTDIAARLRSISALGEYLRQHADGGGFSVGSRHRRYGTAHISCRQLRFTDHRLAAPLERHRRRMVDGDSRA